MIEQQSGSLDRGLRKEADLGSVSMNKRGESYVTLELVCAKPGIKIQQRNFPRLHFIDFSLLFILKDANNYYAQSENCSRCENKLWKV